MRNLIFAVTFLAASAFADDVTIPNTFQAGTPARAADVNANFTAVEASVDDNAADIAANSVDIAANATEIGNNVTDINSNTVAIQDNADAIALITPSGGAFVKSNGQIIGTFLQGQSSGAPLTAAWIWVLSNNGYMFAVAPFSSNATATRTGAVGEMFQEAVVFDGPNCTGQAYSPALSAAAQAQFSSGYVFTSPHLSDPSPVYYSPADSQVLINVSQQSSRHETGCISAVGTVSAAVAILPNDPTITGVPSQRNLDAPITLGR